MRRTLLFLLLLWPSSAWAQPPDETVIVGNDISAAELAKLKARHATEAEIIAAAESKTRDLKIDPGSYRLVGVKANVSLPVLFRETDGAVVSRIGIKAGERWTGWLVKPGEQGPSLVEIEPADFQRWILIGKKQGVTSVLVVENGEPGKTPPRVLAQLNITVGRPIPPVPPGPDPPAPSNDTLVVAARADVAAGRGTADDVAFYREYFRAAVAGLPNYKTNFEFLDAFDDGIENRLGVFKNANAKLPTMRRAVADALNSSGLPRNQITFDAASRARFAEEFTKIADRLKGY